MENSYRIRLKKGDYECEAQGDKEFVLSMLQRFEALTHTTPSAELPSRKKVATAPESGIGGTAKSLSSGEFIRRTGFKKHVDLVLAFGYYLEKHAGVGAFTPGDINNCYYEAKLETSNTSQVIILLIRKGFVMEAKQEGGQRRKKYVLTSSGEQAVETQLQAAQSEEQ